MDDRRAVPRCIDIPVTIHQCIVTHMGKETWLAAEAINLSSRGVCLLLDDSLNSGESIYLLATVRPDDKEPRELSVTGVTTQCRPLGEGRWSVGIQFLDLAEYDHVEWEGYLACGV